MAARIALAFILTIVCGLVLYVLAMVPVHNSIMSFFMNSGLIMSVLNYQIAVVLGWTIIGLPFLLVLFAAISAYNEIVYQTGG
jgi:hypothetical protein